MTIFLIVLSIFLTGFTFFYELRNKSVSVFLWAGLLVFFGFSHFSQVIDSGYETDAINKVSIFVSLFCMLYLASRLMTRFVLHKPKLDIYNTYFGFPLNEKYRVFAGWLFWILIFSTFLYSVLAIQYSGGITHLSKSMIYSFRSKNFLVLALNYLWQASVPITLYYLVSKNRRRFVICASCIVIKSIVAFTRTYLIELFVAIVLYWFFRGKRIKIKTIVICAIAGVLGIYAMYLLRGFRYYYNFSDFGSVSFLELNQKALGFVYNRNGDLFLTNKFYQLVEYGKRVPGIIPGATYLRLLLLPIPSSLLFGLKPQDICISLGDFFGNSGRNAVLYTVTPTLFGDLYANFQMLGCLGGILWAAIVSMLDRICEKRKPVFKALTIMLVASAYINIARGSVYNPFCNIFYSVIIQWIVFTISSKIRFRFYVQNGQ